MSLQFTISPPLASMNDPSSTRRSEYTFNSKIMVAAMVILFIVVFFVASLHVYAKWFWRPGTMSSPGVPWRRRRRRVDSTSDESFVANVSVGLDSSTINSLPTFTYQAPGQLHDAEPLLECAVCLSEFQAHEKGRFLPNCKHSFHTNCIDMWFHSHSTCPLCRTRVSSVPVHPIPLQRDFPPPLLRTVVPSATHEQDELNAPAQGIFSPIVSLGNGGALPTTMHHPRDEQNTCIQADSPSPPLPHSFVHRQHQEGLANNESAAPALLLVPLASMSSASNGRLLCKDDTHEGSSHMSLPRVGASGSCSTRSMSTEIPKQPECAAMARCVSLSMPRCSSEDHNASQALKSSSFRMSIKWLLSRESSKGRSRVFPSSEGNAEIEPSTSNSPV